MAPRWLSDWAWIDEADKRLNFDIPKFLRAMNVRDTAANRQEAMELSTEIMKELYPNVAIDNVTVEYGTKRVYTPK